MGDNRLRFNWKKDRAILILYPPAGIPDSVLGVLLPLLMHVVVLTGIGEADNIVGQIRTSEKDPKQRVLLIFAPGEGPNSLLQSTSEKEPSGSDETDPFRIKE